MNPELARQQQLLQALWRGDEAGLAGPGLWAYRANAGAAAERALAAACPTVQKLVGDEAFAAIARRLWHEHPTQRGDLAQWGSALPVFLAADPALQDEPYLADVAHVDLAVHRAEMAADAVLDPAALARLGDHEPEALWLRLAPGAALILSAHPVVHIWQAHRRDDEDRFAAVRAAFAAGVGDTAFVWRHGWRGDVAALDAADTPFMQALLQGLSFGAALDAAPELDFHTWLQRALQLQWLADVALSPPSPETP